MTDDDCREEGGDRHHREAGVTERRTRRLGDRGLAVADRLRDGQRAEDAERDEHVEDRRHAERGVHRHGQLASRVAQVSGGERDDAEAEVREERESDARDDGPRSDGYPLKASRSRSMSTMRHGDEDGEDGEQHDDDQRLRAIDDASSPTRLTAAIASTIAEVKTLSHQPPASSPTKSEVA